MLVNIFLLGFLVACTCTHYRLSPAELTDFDAIFNFET
jgi:hypothetical protein